MLLLLVAVLFAGCSGGEAPLFEAVPPEATGIMFSNDLAEGPAFNILNYLYYYNGGGVAAGDLNGDGLPDLYFTANEGPNQLYLNRGDFRFEDVTEAAGVAGDADWTTGVSMADVNGDGRLDLYVSAVAYLDRWGRNMLFINEGAGPDGVPRFSEQAFEYGLDFEGFSTHAAFFDYDKDGDLDVYLLNHSTHYEGTLGSARLREEPHARAGDRLLRNDGDRFTDVTAEAGLWGGVTGYGLSVLAADLDGDTWTDLYVANDFHEQDYLYYNDGDGTFTPATEAALPHTSQYSMGSDVGDVDGDGRPDLVVLDMLPRDEAILKTSAAADPYDVYNVKRREGYHHQLARNTLQLNRGGRRFSDVGLLAGIHATDWSWSALLADYDLDGRRDLFVTNGIYRRPNDLDYINSLADPSVQQSLAQGITEQNIALVQQMPQVRIPNGAFRQTSADGDLAFEDAAGAWGLAHAGFSNGAIYADLDDDGDLDLVTNNINEPASVYRNRAVERGLGRFLKIRLEGAGANTRGIGAQVRVVTEEGGRVSEHAAEQVPTRGFQSSVEPVLHVGLGTAEEATVVVTWPDGRRQTLQNVPTNQTLTLRQSDASAPAADGPMPQPAADAEGLFRDVTAEFGLDYRHQENTFVDFNREALMPRKVSMEGPALAVGDVDGDGLDDVFAGGAKWQPARLLVQTPDARFRAADVPAFRTDSLHEDVDAAFFDADADGDLDLFVTSGGNEFWGEADALRDRLYLNDGAGGFTRAPDALPDVFENSGPVAPADYDGDGDTDLFVGGRVVARAYGEPARSVLLENDGSGHFRDVTAEKAPGLERTGMVAAAAWTDADGDGALDLVVAGEWMPVRLFRQGGGRFQEATEGAGLAGTNGFWTAATAADLDGDGDEDLVLGNLGRNAYLQGSPDRPIRLYIKDFDGNGTQESLVTSYRGDTAYPLATRDELVKQFTPLRKKYPDYRSFGAARYEDVFTSDERAGATVREVTMTESVLAENRGDGTYTLRPLPLDAQLFPIYAALPTDIDRDGTLDLVLAGNFSGVPPLQGRMDAGYGLVLRGQPGGAYKPLDLDASGLVLDGEVRHLAPLRLADGRRVIVAARNGEGLQVVTLDAAADAVADAVAAR